MTYSTARGHCCFKVPTAPGCSPSIRSGANLPKQPGLQSLAIEPTIATAKRSLQVEHDFASSVAAEFAGNFGSSAFKLT